MPAQAPNLTDLSSNVAPRLPVDLGSVSLDPKRTMESPTPTQARTQTGPRILVIDDEPRILNFVRRGLRGEGFVVEVADDGAAGLRRAVAEPFDLVILDLLMPGLDGTAVLRGILARQPPQSGRVLSPPPGA